MTEKPTDLPEKWRDEHKALVESAAGAQESGLTNSAIYLRAEAARAIKDADELTAALSAQGAPQGWQPIATAPKDGTEVLGFRGRGAAGQSGQFRAIAKFNGYEWIRIPGSYSWSPTHWMPLPMPPTGETR